VSALALGSASGVVDAPIQAPPQLEPVRITDPREAPVAGCSLADRLAARVLNDPRDRPLLAVITGMSAVLLPFAVVLYVPGLFSLPLAGLYLALVFGLFFDRYILMLHCSRHRRLFKPGIELDGAIDWLLGPLAGQTPGTYSAHHLGMHHVEDNLWDDRSTTLPFQRDSVIDFARYWSRFVLVGVAELVGYLRRHRRDKLARRALVGEVGYLALLGALLWLDWRATTVVLVVPLVAARFGMMAGNWAQHAFVDPTDPGDPYRSSITTINTRYNRRCFNDGYHIGHHLKASRHWTEMPDDFLANLDRYRDERAIVFEGLDYFAIWALLMVKAHRTLARHVVHLGPGPRDDAAIEALLRSRLGPVARPASQAVAA